MHLGATIRLPLQVGMSALMSMGLAALLIGPGIAVLIFIVYRVEPGVTLFLTAATLQALWDVTTQALATIGEESEVAWLFVPLPLLMIVGCMSIRDAFSARAIDVVLDDRGLRVEGGPHDSLAIPWTELDASATRTLERDGKYTLIVERASSIDRSTRIEIADAGLHNEGRRHLDAIAEIIRSFDDPSPIFEPVARLRGDVQRLACPTCREPMPPDDVETVQCSLCFDSIAVASDLRRRIASNRVAAARRADALADARTVLHEPAARSINTRLALIGLLALIVWMVGWAVLVTQAARGTLSALNVILMSAGASTVVAALLWFVAPRLRCRGAARALAFDLGARLSRGTPRLPACRCCDALLPIRHDTATALVLCAYCGADNLFLLPLRGTVSERQPATVTLEQTLSTWRRFGALSPTRAVITLVMVAGAAWAIAASFTPMTEESRVLDDCRRGQWRACVRAGELAERQATVEDITRAVAFYDKACRATADLGCFELARLLRDGPYEAPRDPHRALALFAALCDTRGRADACTSEGFMRLRGKGVDADHQVAYARVARGCEGNNALGCLMQGAFFADGEIVTKDASRAAALYRRSCDLGSEEGCVALADALETGSGVAKDVDAAWQQRRTSCDRGSHTACSFVADTLLSSADSHDHDKGAMLLRRGCNSGVNARSCWRLGRLYAERRLTETEYDTAAKYLGMGCNLGLHESCADATSYVSSGALNRADERSPRVRDP